MAINQENSPKNEGSIKIHRLIFVVLLIIVCITGFGAYQNLVSLRQEKPQADKRSPIRGAVDDSPKTRYLTGIDDNEGAIIEALKLSRDYELFKENVPLSQIKNPKIGAVGCQSLMISVSESKKGIIIHFYHRIESTQVSKYLSEVMTVELSDNKKTLTLIKVPRRSRKGLNASANVNDAVIAAYSFLAPKAKLHKLEVGPIITPSGFSIIVSEWPAVPDSASVVRVSRQGLVVGSK